MRPRAIDAHDDEDIYDVVFTTAASRTARNHEDIAQRRRMLQSQPTRLEHALTTALTRRHNQHTLLRLTTTNDGAIDFSSNDFLSLASSDALRELFLAELTEDTISKRLGSGGSRLLDGNSRYAEQLEEDIAAFHGAESGLLCNSGFDANIAVFTCIPQSGDVIIYDEFIHASVHDGMKRSRAGRHICLKHNDVSALQSVLEQLVLEDAKIQHGDRNVFLAVETVYSMDGDVAPLREMAALLGDLLPKHNGYLIVDEAHATGVFGSCGRGLVNQLGLEDQVLIRLHTFGKALAANGAVILCSAVLKLYLLNYARPLVYTTFMSYPSLAAIRASYTYLMAGQTEPRAQHVRYLSKVLHRRLLALQDALSLPAETRHLLSVPQDCPGTPILAVFCSEAKALGAHCRARDVIVRGVGSPTVAAGTERLRICVHAGNTEAQFDTLIRILFDWAKGRSAALGAEGHELRARL